KLHALHNEEVCDYLLASKKYNDWVTTTAFYSAIHFVQNEIFPLIKDGVEYSTFNSYCSKVLRKNNKQVNKHKATINIVKENLPLCASDYRWLYSACMNARYNSYVVSEQKAIEARN